MILSKTNSEVDSTLHKSTTLHYPMKLHQEVN